MGQEIDCTIRYKEKALEGKAYLETDHLLFRGDDRLKVLFKEMTKVEAAGGTLRIEFADGPAEFDLGAAAEKWAQKILQPPSRLTKLGLKPGMAVKAVGEFEPDFLEDLKNSHVVEAVDQADLIFLIAETKSKLSAVRKLAPLLGRGDGALWIIYPRGVERIREAEVIKAGRDANLKDVKVISFSLTHTALKFVVPVLRRRKTAPARTDESSAV